MDEKTATEIAMQRPGLTIREAMIDRVARRIAKRQYGENCVGYESVHYEAAEDYVAAIASLLPTANAPE